MSIDHRGRHLAAQAAPREPVVVAVESAEATPEAVEFVRFCYRRSGVVWPDLYDEMCAVAARGAFRGLDYEELFTFGVSFALTEMPRMAAIAHRVVDEERSARIPFLRPVLAASS